MNQFTVGQPLPGIFHIQDAAGVCFTLVPGERETLLWDTGVGLYDVAGCIAPYVCGKLHVVLSHGHYDHACGQHYFEESYVHPDDLERCRQCTGRNNRSLILNRIRERGLIGGDYTAEQFLCGTPETIRPLTGLSLDLGGLDVQFISAPGHTPGSIAAYIPQRRLLLIGDNWNPHTWLFFPESRSLSAYTQMMRQLRGLKADYVLRPHDPDLTSIQRFTAFIDGLNEYTFAAAQPCPIPNYSQYHTYCCYPEPESKLVFNKDKIN